MVKSIKAQAILKLGIGLIMLISVLWGYSPIPFSNEYTFLSNAAECLIMIFAGIILLTRKKHIPTYIDLCMVIMSLIMLGICLTSISVFSFDGAFLFLHVINPVLLLLHWIFIVEKGKIRSPLYVLTVLIFPLAYITYLFIFGYITGDYIYPVFDVNALGVLHVAVFVSIVAVVFLALAFALYFIDRRTGRKSKK